MVMVSRRNRLRRYFSRRQISLRVKAGSSWIGWGELACRKPSVKEGQGRLLQPRPPTVLLTWAGLGPAARPSSRRSSLKSIHWIDLPGFAGRSSPSVVGQLFNIMVHLLRRIFAAIAID